MCLGFLTCTLGGCAGISEQQTILRQLGAQGQYQQAAVMLDEPQTIKAYGEKNRLLWELNRGALARTLAQPEQSLELLESAERRIEAGRAESAGDIVASWIANDNALPFQAEPYEDIYVNVLKLLANLELGRVDGGATVEARRLAGKANILRDRYLQLTAAANRERPESAQIAQARGSAGGLIATNNAGEFVESPLGTYLSAISFMKAGDSSFQQVAGRRLVDSLEVQKGLLGAVRTEDFLDLGTRSSGDLNVLVVALSGAGPTKAAERIGPLAILSVPIYLELPRLVEQPSEVAAARVRINGGPAGETLNLIEDFNAVASENHRRQLPLIYQKTLIRYLIKAGITVGLTEGVQSQHGNNDEQWIRMVGGLVGLGLLMATERADLRCWTFLPGQARVATLKLPPGVHTLSVEYLADNGAVLYTAPGKVLTVTEDGLATGVFQFWR